MALQLLAGGKVAAFLAQQGLKKASKQSVELFGYNFINLIMTLSIYFILALLIAKYFEAVILGKGLINDIAKALGFFPAFPENTVIRKLFVDGYGDQKFVYWDLIKGIAIVLVIIEWMRFNEMQKANGGETSIITHGVFSLIVGLLTVITISKFTETIKAFNGLKTITTLGGETEEQRRRRRGR